MSGIRYTGLRVFGQISTRVFFYGETSQDGVVDGVSGYAWDLS